MKNNNPSNDLGGALQLSSAECQGFEFLSHFRMKEFKMLNSHGMRKAFGYLFLKNALLVCFAFLDLLLVFELVF